MPPVSPDQEEIIPEDQKGAEPLSSGEQAKLDQIETGLKDKSSGSITGRVSGSKSSLKKKLLIGSGLGGGVISIGIVLFLLLLFKNIHIKNLFVDYEFAKFNRAFRNRLEKSIEDPEADPKGTSDSTVTDSTTPEDALAAAQANEIDTLKADPSKLTEAVDETQQLDLSTAGSAGVIGSEIGVTPDLPELTGQNNGEITKTTDQSIKDSAAGDEQPLAAPDDAIQGAADQTKAAIDAGVIDDNALQQAATKGFSSGLNSAVGKLTGPFVYATFMCIARAVFDIPGHVIQAMQLKGLANESAYVTKSAECQQQGNPTGSCPLTQIGDVATKFDTTSGGKTQSFTTSCAYLRSSGQVAIPAGSGQNCTDLSDNLRPSTDIGGIAGTLVQVSNTLDGHINVPHVCLGGLCSPSQINVPIGAACDLILNRTTQYVFAGVNIFSTIAAAISTGPETFGAGDVATAAVQTTAAIFATKAGAALALDAGLRYSGLDFRRNFSGTMFGNLMGAGTKARADATCATNGCHQLTPQENTTLALDIHADMIKDQQTKGLAYRLFSPKNPVSTAGILADKIPPSPRTALAVVGQFFATMFNPPHLGKSLLGLINPVRPAWAADVEYQTYGLPDYGFTDGQLNQYGVVDNSRWINNPAHFTADDKTKYDQCFQADLNVIFEPKAYCNATPGVDPKLDHYRLYKLDQRVTQDFVLLNNNQSEPGATAVPTPTSGSTSGCINPFSDPRWSGSRTDEGVDYNTPSGVSLPVYAICNGTITSTIGTLGKGWPGGVYINYKLTSGPFTGKCIYTAEQLSNVLPVGTNVTAGQQIATANGGTEWGWSQGVQTPATPGPEGLATEGGKAFARFIISLGGTTREPPGAGSLYAGASCP